MHPNPSFRATENDHSLAFARSRGFGTLTMNAAPWPLLAHVPFVLISSDSCDLHLVRSNPICAACETPQPAIIAINGPDGYISPDWYGTDDQVPTWNYVAVHLRGTLEKRPQSELPALLDRLSENFEAMLAPKPLWSVDKMSEGTAERMMRSIVPFRLHIEDVQSTWKLGQNKTEEARQAAARAVRRSPVGQEQSQLADMMTVLPPQKR